jgi:hypothetical protein
MELPTNTSPTTSTELEQLGKEQALGEATNLGCPRFETPSAISGQTAIPRGSQTAIPGGSQTAIPRGPTTALTARG